MATRRFLELHSRKDKIAKIITIKTTEKIIKKPMTKVCILSMDEDIATTPFQNAQPKKTSRANSIGS